MIKNIAILILFILCWIFLISTIQRDKECIKQMNENLELRHKCMYKQKQIDTLEKIVNSDKIVLFNGKIVYW